MMTDSLAQTPFEELIQSDLFTFYVGDEKKPFCVHSKAIAATSPVFDSLVNGGLSEAQTRSAELQNVDPGTFIRFLEYAYRHDYTDPSLAQEISSHKNEVNGADSFAPTPHSIDPADAENDSIEQTSSGATAAWGTWTNARSAPSGFGAMPSSFNDSLPVKKVKKHKKLPTNTRAAFDRREYAYPFSKPSSPSSALANPDSMTPQASTPDFLAHARLYTLADMRMVHPLRDLTLHKLHKALVGFELHPERLGDVVDLARYAYEQGEDRSTDGKIDALRDMVVSYVACEMKALGKHAEFRNLMDGGGEFAGDFWDIVSQEIP